MELIFYQKVFRKILKYHILKIPSSQSQVVPYGQTDKAELIVAFFFRNFSNTPKQNI